MLPSLLRNDRSSRMTGPTRILSEFESKRLLRGRGVLVSRESLAPDAAAAAAAARELGFPVAVKLCAEGLVHKSERNLVRLWLGDEASVAAAADDLLSQRRSDESSAALLVQEMVSGKRELIAGLIRDRQFGPCVMLGLGGILAEALKDVVFRVAPLEEADVEEMIGQLRASAMLGEFRGCPAVDRARLAKTLLAIGHLGLDRTDIVSIDVNPLIVCGDQPVAVDAVVELLE